MSDNENKAQCTLIMAYLKQYGSITRLQAQQPPIMCQRLAARINEIRKAGVAVRTDMHYKISPVTGKRVRFAVYTLVKDGDTDGLE